MHQALLQALTRDTQKYPLHQVAWALEWDAIIDETTGKPFKWFAAKQVVPLDPDLKKMFNSWDYRKYVHRLKKELKFSLNEEKYQEKKQLQEDE